MEKPFVLHIITPEKNASPFDVNMAYDAGWNSIIPYTTVEIDEVKTLVQDTIFSRSPSALKRTGIFFGGRDCHTAMEMIDEAKKSMVPPFEVSVFADPSGAFTTAAGMVAVTEKALKEKFNLTLAGMKIAILGGTGPVGIVSAAITAKAGADVYIVGRNPEKTQKIVTECITRYGVANINVGVDGEKESLLSDTDIVFGTAAPGIEIMDEKLVRNSKKLKICADTNAVPPSGIYGVGVSDNVVEIKASPSGCYGIGALAIGNVKYKAQHECLKLMCTSDKPVYLHFEHAFEFAQKNA